MLVEANPYQTIRELSVTLRNGLVVVFFILSATNSDNELLAVQREQKLYGDIIMSDLVESYDNLVHKFDVELKQHVLQHCRNTQVEVQVHACMSFFTNYCREASFLMKADDDVAIHFDRLLDSFQVNSDSEEKLFCSILNNTEPIRVLNDKWTLQDPGQPYRNHALDPVEEPVAVQGAIRKPERSSRLRVPFGASLEPHGERAGTRAIR
ncbi:hypothetical protein ANCCEY_10882 [Ancylostoma ceylanicum]|uniref:Hexosyltransferase n=1 Tax=Ancylostoma ceylanicum TaxID=53326 RepID=A0A0D6LD73_9BILA|nr:hypothetical protein ANCCEY_10882 [Ancylostoma ceylanicum]